MSSKKSPKKTTPENNKTLLSPARITQREPPKPLDLPTQTDFKSTEIHKESDIYLTQELQRRGHQVDYVYLNNDDRPIYVKANDANGCSFYLSVDIPSRMLLDNYNSKRVSPDTTIPVNIENRENMIKMTSDYGDGVALETPTGYCNDNKHW